MWAFVYVSVLFLLGIRVCVISVYPAQSAGSLKNESSARQLFLSPANMRRAPPPALPRETPQNGLARSRHVMSAGMNEHIEEIQASDQECASLDETLF